MQVENITNNVLMKKKIKKGAETTKKQLLGLKNALSVK